MYSRFSDKTYKKYAIFVGTEYQALTCLEIVSVDEKSTLHFRVRCKCKNVRIIPCSMWQRVGSCGCRFTRLRTKETLNDSLYSVMKGIKIKNKYLGFICESWEGENGFFNFKNDIQELIDKLPLEEQSYKFYVKRLDESKAYQKGNLYLKLLTTKKDENLNEIKPKVKLQAKRFMQELESIVKKEPSLTANRVIRRLSYIFKCDDIEIKEFMKELRGKKDGKF